MHFSVLVPVKISSISDEANAKAKAANDFLDAANQLSNAATSDDRMADIMNKLYLQHAQSVSAPFSAAVAEAVSEAMDPYAQDTEDERYRVFEDETEELHDAFETGTTSGILYNGKYYLPYELNGFKVCDDGAVREQSKDGKYFLSPKAQKMLAVENVPNKEFYGTFRKFANTHSRYDKQKRAWGYYCNPWCFWDWYSIGGRWLGSLLVKDTVEEVMVGVSGAFDNSAPLNPPGYKWVDAARLKDIEFEEMARQEESRIRQSYAKYKAIWDGTYVASEDDDFARHIRRDEDGLYSFGNYVYNPNIGVENVVENHDCTAANVLGKIFHAYLDTEANVPEESGYYDRYSHSEWSKAINEFVDSLDPETVIAVADCHM